MLEAFAVQAIQMVVNTMISEAEKTFPKYGLDASRALDALGVTGGLLGCELTITSNMDQALAQTSLNLLTSIVTGGEFSVASMFKTLMSGFTVGLVGSSESQENADGQTPEQLLVQAVNEYIQAMVDAMAEMLETIEKTVKSLVDYIMSFGESQSEGESNEQSQEEAQSVGW